LKNGKVGDSMLDFTWKLFQETGDIQTYLLYKELERELGKAPEKKKERRSNRHDPSTY